MSPLERAAAARLAHVWALARPLRLERAPKCPDLRSQTRVRGAPDVSRLPQEAPCKCEFSCRSGPRPGARLLKLGRRAEDPGSGQKLRLARNRRCPRAVVPQARPLPSDSKCLSDIPIPTCSGKFPPEGSTRAMGTQERGKRSLGKGAEGFCLLGKRRRPPQEGRLGCQTLAQATSH